MTTYPVKIGIFDLEALEGDTMRVGVNSANTRSATMNQLAFWDRIATPPKVLQQVSTLQ